MTTGGEGGMVTTNDDRLWSTMWSYKDHGKSWEAVYQRSHPPGPRLVHDTFGTNWRMLEMQAAIGLVQLERMPDWTARRTVAAEAITSVLRQYASVRIPDVPNYASHAYYRLYAFVRPENLVGGWSRDQIIDEINAQGVPCMHGSQSEIYLEAAFDGTGWRPEMRLAVAQELGETSIAFLVHPSLTDAEITLTCDVVDEVLARATAGRKSQAPALD